MVESMMAGVCSRRNCDDPILAPFFCERGEKETKTFGPCCILVLVSYPRTRMQLERGEPSARLFLRDPYRIQYE